MYTVKQAQLNSASLYRRYERRCKPGSKTWKGWRQLRLSALSCAKYYRPT